MNKRYFKLMAVVIIFGLIAVSSVFTQNLSQFYQASILQVSQIKEFDGTVYPISVALDLVRAYTDGTRYDNFEDISEDYFVEVPEYDPVALAVDVASLTSSSTDKARRNAKLTYAVVYMGEYGDSNRSEGIGTHPAVDVILPVGTPVYSIANGEVVKAEKRTTGFGNHVVIGHPDVPDPEGSGEVDLYSSYSHLDSFIVEVGDIVQKGQLIGYVGNTGNSSGSHLHFQIDEANSPYKPYWPSGSTLDEKIADGKMYTVHPMDFVEDNLDYTGSLHAAAGVADYETGDDDNDTSQTAIEDDDNDEVEDVEEKLGGFEFFYESKDLSGGERVTFAVEAQDEDGDKLDSYEESVDLKVVTDDDVDTYTVSFSEGSATFSVDVPDINGSMNLVMEDGSVEGREEFMVTSDAMYTYEMSFSDAYVLVDEEVKMQIKVKQGGVIDRDYDRSDPILLSGDNVLEFSDDSLSVSDFEEGVASVYVAASDAGEYAVTLSVGEQEFESEEISVIDTVKDAVSLRVEHDGKFIPGRPETITITALDEDGNPTPSYSSVGKLVLVDTPEGGEFSQDYLERDDFTYGVATVEYTRDDTSSTVIEVGQGVIRGHSDSLVASDAEDIFTDVDETHENAVAIAYLKENNIIGGYEDGSFQPGKTVSRVEALKMILLGFNISLTPSADLEFEDTYDDQWYAPYVARAVKLGVVKGYDDGSFKPAQTVNKAELLKILFEATNADVSETDEVTSAPYNDVSLDQWFVGYADYAENRNLVPVDDDNNLSPADGMTRADVAEVIYRLMVVEKTGASKYKEELSI